MGLLSDPQSRERVLLFLIRHNSKLCILCYALGLVWFLLLPLPPLSAPTYISENALLPGLVKREFVGGPQALSLSREFAANKALVGGLPVEWLNKTMTSLGLEVHTQTFAVDLPFPDEINERYHVRGTNVQGVVRARRAASTEALVLHVPFLPEANDQAMGLALSLAAHFRKQVYWAKDLIVLVTEHDLLGIQAWLGAYHGINLTSLGVRSSELGGYCGALQAAITLQLSSDVATSIDLQLHGPNGLLPNLDLPNLVHHLCLHAKVLCTVQELLPPQEDNAWWQSMHIMLLQALGQASTKPASEHGLFLRHRVEALGLKAINSHRQEKASLEKLGRLLEGVFRSLNNLLERFHQSFFFYLLPSLQSYVSIGNYAPCAAAILVVLFLCAVELWAKLNPEKERRTREAAASNPASIPWLSVIGSIVIAHGLGIALYLGPLVAHQRAANYFDLPEDEAVSLTALGIGVSSLSLPHRGSTPQGWIWLKLFALLELGMLLLALDLLNFPLAFMLAIPTVPAAVVSQPSHKTASIALLLVASPAVISLMGLAMKTELNPHGPTSGQLGGFIGLFLRWLQCLSQSILEHQSLGTNLYPLFTLGLFPCWLQLWHVALWKE
uniref:Glycosylphosphatidylinositol anchor attachment 1 n=1 Tax=Eptatretus burgeri TaxID=7764 RepID=A0A8C4QZ97_EPTBU